MELTSFKIIIITIMLLLVNGVFVGINLVGGELKTIKFFISLTAVILLSYVLIQEVQSITVVTQ